MTITLKLELTSGQSLQGAPLELLEDGKPIARGLWINRERWRLLPSLVTRNWQ
jgi:hypothetical protein